MAEEIEKLVVQLSADFKAYQNAMAKASGITRAELAKLKDVAANVGADNVVAFAGAERGVRRYGSAAAHAAKQTSVLTTQTGNLAAQFQDIAVQLQAGTNPLTIAVQQGTQISAVLGGAGAGGAVRALGGAFASLISPVSLVTIGLIAAGGAAVQYVSSLINDGGKSEEELKKQSQLIKQVAKDWGDALPAVRAYADELDRAQKASDVRAAGQATIDSIIKPAKESVADLAIDLDEVTVKLQALGADPSQIVNLQQAFDNLKESVKDGSTTAEDNQKVTDALIAIMNSGIPVVGDFKAQFDALAPSLINTANAATVAASQVNAALNAMRTFRDAEAKSIQNLELQTAAGERYAAEQARINGLTADQLKLENEVNRVKAEAADQGALISPEDAKRIAAERLAAEQRRSDLGRAPATPAASTGGGRARKDELERETASIEKRTAAVQAQNAAQAGLNPLLDDYGFAIAKAKAEQDLLTAAQQAGVNVTDGVKQNIDDIATAYAQAVASSNQLDDAQRKIADRAKEVGDLQRDLSSDLVQGFLDGASAAEILADALANVGKKFLDFALDGIFSERNGTLGGISGGGGLLGGAIIPGILHSGGTAGVDGYGTGRVFSPSVFRGARRYHSGLGRLQPGEIPAILQSGEKVIPRGGGASGGTHVTFEAVVSKDGNIIPVITSVSDSRVNQGLKRVPAIMEAHMTRNR